MHDRFMKWLAGFTLAMVAFFSGVATAQDAPKPAPRPSQFDSPSRWDIFAGYSYLAPKGTVDVLQSDGVTTLPQTFHSMEHGMLGSGTYYFNKYVGAQVETGAHDLWTN